MALTAPAANAFNGSMGLVASMALVALAAPMR